MKIPKQLQIAGRKIDIIMDNKRAIEERYNGACYFDQNKIIIDNTNSVEKQLVTLIHEVLHYINALLHKDGSVVDNEEIVRPQSELLYQIIRQIENEKKSKHNIT